MKNTKTKMNKPVYLGLSILEISISFGMIILKVSLQCKTMVHGYRELYHT